MHNPQVWDFHSGTFPQTSSALVSDLQDWDLIKTSWQITGPVTVITLASWSESDTAASVVRSKKRPRLFRLQSPSARPHCSGMNWPHPELAEVSSADQTRINLNPTDDYKQKQNAGKSFWKRRRTKETFTRVSQPPLLVTASLAFLATFSPKLSFNSSPGLWISLSPETAADQHAVTERFRVDAGSALSQQKEKHEKINIRSTWWNTDDDWSLESNCLSQVLLKTHSYVFHL